MAQFRARVGTTEGAIAERYVSAATASGARDLLAADGLEVFDLAERASGAFPMLRKLANLQIGRSAGAGTQRGLFRRGNRVASSDLLLLSQELAALVKAGLPLLRCVDILRARRAGTVAGSMLDRARREVASGHSLSGAFHPEIERVALPELFVTSLEVGEASGDLVTALRRYAEHLQKSHALRHRVRSAMMYPVVLLGVALIVVVILLTVVIPRFASFYASSGAELPFLTRALVGLSGFVSGYGLLLLLVGVAGVFGYSWWTKTPAGRATVDGLRLRVPILGGVLRRYFGLESARTLATLLRGGAPLVRALVVTSQGTSNVAFRKRIEVAAEQVSQGSSLHEAMEAQGLLDPLGLELVQVGESTGALEEMLEHVASTYDEVLDRQVTLAVSVMEPAMLVFMGLLVAAILLSLYLPLFQIVQVVG